MVSQITVTVVSGTSPIFNHSLESWAIILKIYFLCQKFQHYKKDNKHFFVSLFLLLMTLTFYSSCFVQNTVMNPTFTNFINSIKSTFNKKEKKSEKDKNDTNVEKQTQSEPVQGKAKDDSPTFNSKECEYCGTALVECACQFMADANRDQSYVTETMIEELIEHYENIREYEERQARDMEDVHLPPEVTQTQSMEEVPLSELDEHKDGKIEDEDDREQKDAEYHGEQAREQIERNTGDRRLIVNDRGMLRKYFTKIIILLQRIV